ncbi:MAG: hypothetical protein PHS64_01705 [Candidatus Omnitrophica bacterium]|nr:hypothetical protein [Candidatus Omnitrophota bacterium]
MNKKSLIRMSLVLCLFFLTFGGWLLHVKIHPLDKNSANFIPFIIGIVNFSIVPLLFCFSRTTALAYIVNGFFAIIGTIVMAHFSIVHFEGPVTPVNVMMNTLFADIVILWANFAVGKALFHLNTFRAEGDRVTGGRFFRYPNMGWWWVHLAGASVVYYLGNLIWK